LRVDIFEPRIVEWIVTIDPKGTRVIGSWTLGEMLWEKAEFENRNSQILKGEIDIVRWFGGTHVT
jgi:hypothetical protein